MHTVVLDPRDTADTLLGDSQLWCDEDFESEGGAEEIEAAADQQHDASGFADVDDAAVSLAHSSKAPQRANLIVTRGVAGYVERS